ncbi:holo-ACP synthase [Clostridium sp. SYSU_GA19001]|uniref:holo-ACP synthase n=1 Tax=Clostridium caldaquaticum TaxID=2940653 RepID=UPI0020771F44|nr:holo-ACP synthase [Clostridium caldaquaticum]MCM8709912.1 holo-ACP synthase [Clostridium caldaquaticum]
MIVGIGTDILHMSTLSRQFLKFDDPFFCKTFTEEEQRLGALNDVPHIYFCMRFAAKEAVFKALNTYPDRLKHWNEIEILNSDNGAPYVRLHGNMKKAAEEKGIQQIMLSLSYDKDYAIAFCVTST